MPQNIDNSSSASHSSMMGVKSASLGETIVKKEPPNSPVGSPPPVEKCESPSAIAAAREATRHLELLQQLKQSHQIQQEFLRHEYVRQQQQLAERQEHQLQQHIKYLEQQTKRAEEERAEKQRQEEERIEAIKSKRKEAQSAVASPVVKQILHDKLMMKIRQENEGNIVSGRPSNIQNWPPGLMPVTPEDFPLRKTVDSATSPDSGQSSPPNGLPPSRSSSGSTPIHEESGGGGSPYQNGPGGQGGSCSDLSHPFSSLPNISLGRPPHSTQTEGMKLAMVSETEMVSAVRSGMAITGHVLPSTLPNYGTLPSLDNDLCLRRNSSQVMTAMDTGGSSSGGPLNAGGFLASVQPLSDTQGRLSRTHQRTLGRTQSAPLPLGHPMLQGAPPSFMPHGGQPSQLHQYDLKHEHHQHSIIKQHIRQAVLKRTGSKNHVENVEEETEAAVAQAIGGEKSEKGGLELIDLTDRKMDTFENGSMKSGVSISEGLYLTDRDPASSFFPHRDFQMLKPPSIYGSMVYGARSGSHIARPLSRTFSSPLVTSNPTLCQQQQEANYTIKQGFTTGLCYDSGMVEHKCECKNFSYHPEHGGRIESIWQRLEDTGLQARCHRLKARKATLEEIQTCHSDPHTYFFGSNCIKRQALRAPLPIKSFVRLQCGGIGVDSDTTWNEMTTSNAARLAAGCVLEAAFKVATGELENAYAVVRPPGHHAEYQQAMGFCFFNSVSIAAKQLHQKLSLNRILIIDWDVHHGNGTQSIFYEDPNVLYISIHRYDDGSFFPGTGAPSEVGEGDGFGLNVNIAWSGGLNPPMGDAEYMAAFRTVIMPIAVAFNPTIVLVSAGFDACVGHPPPLGGYNVTPACFAYMTKELMLLANGKVVLCLEGGYDLDAICKCSVSCTQALLGDNFPSISDEEMNRRPVKSAVETLQTVIAVQSFHWPAVSRSLSRVSLSAIEAKAKEDEEGTLTAMASLRVDHHGSHHTSPSPSPHPPPSPVLVQTNDEEEPMEEDDVK